MIKIKVLLALIFLILFSSCISRLSRPAITGVIVDYDKKPVVNCQVGETVTDSNGSFYLKEIRYNKFLLSEMMIMEAPRLHVEEPISKAGFEDDAIVLSHPFGGGQAKGAKYQIDTIFLKKVDQQFDIAALLLNKNWDLSFTKSADTIYMVRKGFVNWCKTERCHRFYASYQSLTDNDSYHRNFSNDVIKRFVEVEFKGDHSGRLQQIQHYKQTFDGPNKESDTLKNSFKWGLIHQDVIKFNMNKPAEIAHSYKIAMVDLYQLLLIKNKE